MPNTFNTSCKRPTTFMFNFIHHLLQQTRCIFRPNAQKGVKIEVVHKKQRHKNACFNINKNFAKSHEAHKQTSVYTNLAIL